MFFFSLFWGEVVVIVVVFFVFLADVLLLLSPLPFREELFFWDKAKFGAASSFHVNQAIFRHTGLFTHKQQTNKEAVILFFIIIDNSCMTFHVSRHLARLSGCSKVNLGVFLVRYYCQVFCLFVLTLTVTCCFVLFCGCCLCMIKLLTAV